MVYIKKERKFFCDLFYNVHALLQKICISGERVAPILLQIMI